MISAINFFFLFTIGQKSFLCYFKEPEPTMAFTKMVAPFKEKGRCLELCG